MSTIGLILAAGAGRRLRPHTDSVPKALVPVGDGRTVLQATLQNFADVGIERCVVVVGYRAEAIERRVPELEADSGVTVELVHNDHAEDRNNAYSLWCARSWLRHDVVLANGDTLHPASVERALLDTRQDGLALAVDLVKSLGDEEMKVRLDDHGAVQAISKGLPWDVAGEYIGVCWLPAARGAALEDALRRTWESGPQQYYEDAFQLLVDEGERIAAVGVGDIDWVEIDDHADLARAEAMACRS